MEIPKRALLFGFFFVSGFCGLAYQVIWTRLAFASFGIITPVLSVVISVFMLGLSIGSWGGGRLIGPLCRKFGLSAICFYGIAEGIIGLGAFAVPALFGLGRQALLGAGEMNSVKYLALSAAALAAAILPWCLCMGTTFPFMMAYIREKAGAEAGGFSFLYLANVLGAMCGVLLTGLVLIELLGFRGTLWFAALGNFAVAARCVIIGWNEEGRAPSAAAVADPNLRMATASTLAAARRRWIASILFTTGFVSMAMEVVWTRAFAPVLRTLVYSFALVVFTYLGATFFGSWLYRKHRRAGKVWSSAVVIALLMVAANLPIVANDSRWAAPPAREVFFNFSGSLIVLAGIVPFCALLGYLTPGLIDEYSAGEPAAAGRAYAVNILGCILGPLFASYGLMPWLRENQALLLLSAPFFVMYFLEWSAPPMIARAVVGLVADAVLLWSMFFSQDFETLVANRYSLTEFRRDYAASVVSAGDSVGTKILLVNGQGMTALTPITKFMVDLPMAMHERPATAALIICFGMGTSFRTALNWGVDTTAVELTPGVAKAFGFYHADADRYLSNPKGRIIIDDGRRFLQRNEAQYDVIVIDPPPPLEAAGSSLLYSTEFYRLAKLRLKPHGILATWCPPGERAIEQAVLRSVTDSFPYVIAYRGVTGWGYHFFASMEPIPKRTAQEIVARMPLEARKDLLEWNRGEKPEAFVQRVLAQSISAPLSLDPDQTVRVTDDHPFNEYFLLRAAGFSRR